MARNRINLAAVGMVAVSITALVALFAVLGDLFPDGGEGGFPDGGEGGPVPPIGEAVTLEVSVDLAYFADPPDAAAQRELLASALPALTARMPGVEITQVVSPEAPCAPRLLVEAPISAGLRRPSMIARTLSSGEFWIAPIATEEDLEGTDTSLAQERERFEVWDSREKGPPIGAFAAVRREDGGPHPSVRWMQSMLQDTDAPPGPVPLFLDPTSTSRFGQDDLAKAYPSNGGLGFEIRESRRDDFGAFTARYVSRRLAIAIGDRVVAAPRIIVPLTIGGVITAGSAAASVDDLAQILAHPLRDVPLRAEIVPLEGR
ncbi:MAG: hypothetical protein AAGB93_16630 [Planctomycetota bacterium]